MQSRPHPIAILVVFACLGGGPDVEAPARVTATITHAGGVNDLAVSPDGRLLVTAGVDRVARVWDVAARKQVRELKPHDRAVKAVGFARDGVVVTGDGEGVVRLWDGASGKQLNELRGHAGELTALAVSGDGRRIASGGGDKTICVWDAATGALVRRLRAYQYKAGDNRFEGVVHTLALSPDGSVLACGNQVFDFRVHVLDVNTGEELGRLDEENNHVAKVLFSADGATLATVGTRGRSIGLWEAATWRLRRRLSFARDQWEFPGAFSPDGWTLASAAGTGVNVWDLSAGVVNGALPPGHRSRVTSLAYFADGRLASADQAGTVTVWEPGPLAHPGAQEPPAEELTFSGFEQLWADLAAEDAAWSYDAMWKLARSPAESVKFLGVRLEAGPQVDERRVRQWVRELDDENFLVRERATRELANIGEGAEPFLREAMAGRPSVEVAQRVEVLLSAITSPLLDADALRAMRALEVLERIGTPEAREVLARLAKGVTGSRIRRRAEAAVGRLDGRRR